MIKLKGRRLFGRGEPRWEQLRLPVRRYAHPVRQDPEVRPVRDHVQSTNGTFHFIGDLPRFSSGFAYSRSARPHGLCHLVSER